MTLNLSQPRSFTVHYPGRVNQLAVDTLVSKSFDPEMDPAAVNDVVNNAKKYLGIWDTGATNSVISQRVVDECALEPIGMTKVHSSTDVTECETFLVSFILPNKVGVPTVKVTKGLIADCDVLIGMDIIGGGDFAISHRDGLTTFSFRLPSLSIIDFARERSGCAHSGEIPATSPCPCGSGRKYKRCCGK